MAGTILHRPFQIPGPAVEGALDLRRLAGTVRGLQFRAPMQAAVVEGLDLPLVGAADQDRHLADVIDIIVAALGNMFLAAGILPPLLQHFLHFQEIGRASCRERVCQYGYISMFAVSIKKKNNTKTKLYKI